MARKVQNLIGQKFGRLQCLVRQEGAHAYLCSCECGGESVVLAYNLTSGNTRSCGCLFRQTDRKGPDHSGERHGKLLLKSRSEDGKRYDAICDCGKPANVLWASVQASLTSSCGCLQHAKKNPIWEDPDCSSLKVKLMCGYKAGAQSRGLCWDLSPREFESLIRSSCYYCGFKGNTRTLKLKLTEDHSLVANGIDRKDSSRGYSTGNCVSCCFVCNRAKSAMDFEEWREYCLRLSRHLGSWE